MKSKVLAGTWKKFGDLSRVDEIPAKNCRPQPFFGLNERLYKVKNK